MPYLGESSLALALWLFVAAAVAILLVGTRLAAVADALAQTAAEMDAETETLSARR